MQLDERFSMPLASLAIRRHAAIYLGYDFKGRSSNVQRVLDFISAMTNLTSLNVTLRIPDEIYNPPDSYRAALLSYIASIPSHPGRPVINHLTIVDAQASEIYSICATLSPLRMRRLTVVADHLESTPATAQHLDLKVSALNVLDAASVFYDLYTYVVAPDSLRELHLPAMMLQEYYTLLQRFAPSVHSLTWMPSVTPAQPMAIAWTSLRSLQINGTLAGLGLAASVRRSLRHLDVRSLRDESQVQVLRELRDTVRLCHSLEVLIFSSMESSGIDSSTDVIVGLQNLLDICTARDIKLVINAESTYQPSIASRQSIMPTIAQHLRRLELSFEDSDFEATQLADSARATILAQQSPTFTRLTSLTLNLQASLHTSRISTNTSTIIFEFLRHHPMPSLAALHFNLTSAETLYISQVTQIISDRVFPRLERIGGHLELIASGAKDWDGEVEKQARRSIVQASQARNLDCLFVWSTCPQVLI